MSYVRRVVLAIAAIAMVGGLFSTPAGAHIDLANPHGPEIDYLRMTGTGIHHTIYEGEHLQFTDGDDPWRLVIHFNDHAGWYRVTVNGQQGYCQQVERNQTGIVMENDPFTFAHSLEAGTYVIEIQSFRVGVHVHCDDPAEAQTFTVTKFDLPNEIIGDHPSIPEDFTSTNPFTKPESPVPTQVLPGGISLGF